MKRILLSITLFLSIFLLTACSSSDSISEIKYADFQKKIADKESFILEVVQDGCSYCESFTPKFDKVLTKYEVKANSLNLTDLSDAERKEFNNNYQISGTPTVLFFKDGKESSILNRISGNKDEDTIISKLKVNGYIK